MDTISKIVWAVDAFHNDPKSQIRGLKAVDQLIPQHEKTIQPVAMLFSGQFNSGTSQFLGTWHDLAAAAEKNVSNLIRASRVKGLPAPRLLKVDGTRTAHAVRDLIQFALTERAEMIAVTSHGRKGASRLLLGSFAETLVLHSPLPVLVVNPAVKLGTRIKVILFPTDFSGKSRLAFDRVLPMAKALSAQILILHKVAFLYPDMGYTFAVPPVSRESVKDYIKGFQQAAEAWVADAKKMGVKATTHVDSSSRGRTLDEILKVAKKLGPSGIVAMASESGPVGTVLLGSLTRQVLRSASCPVLVIHPEEKALAKDFLVRAKDIVYAYSANPVLT